MSITIKHLEGPLAGKQQPFDDSCKTIEFGRAAGAQVSYPAECVAVGEKHLELKQSGTGGYTIALCGARYVEVNGKEAKDGERIAPDSIIKLGDDGPTFQVLLPGIAIQHLTGRLAGQTQFFEPGVEQIVFGRPPGIVDVAYPADDSDVGRVHFSLKRTKTGAYCVELTAGHFVAIDGTQAENGQVVSSGSILRLANKQGPSFAVHIEKAESGGIETRPNEVQVPLGKKVEKAIRYGAYALAAIAVAVLGTISYFHYQQQIQDAQLAALYKDLDAAKAEARKRAKTEFSPAVIDRLERAVYLVAKDEGGKPLPEATAWAFAPNLLATNAHVTEALSDHEDEFFLVAPDGTHIKIKNVVSHPGYSAFASYKTKLGTTLYGNFTPLDLINEYDVGTIEIDPKTPLPVDPTTQQPVTLKLASDEQLKALTPGTAVASAGFPSENVKGSATLTKSPPTLHFGFISSLTDVFMCRAEPANQLLIVHSVPVTGGASGSPLIDASGKVIGIVNGGNTNVIDNAGEDGKLRMSNAVQINYAQRVDLLKELDENNAHKEIAADQSYWDKMAAQFDDRFGLAVAAFKDLATSRYNVGTGKETRIGGGVLDPGNSKSIKLVQQTFEFNALPGHVYGFIADAEGGVPIALNVKKNGTDEFLRDAKDKRQSSEPDPAPTAWVTVSERTTLDVTVWSLTRLPAQFSLYAFTWEQPKTGSASQANSQPAVSQQ